MNSVLQQSTYASLQVCILVYMSLQLIGIEKYFSLPNVGMGTAGNRLKLVPGPDGHNYNHCMVLRSWWCYLLGTGTNILPVPNTHPTIVASD